jgi:hypothetical protein
MKGIYAAVSILTGLCLGLPSPAGARTVHGIYGAVGDTGDRDECAPGWYLVGVSVNTGAWWDKMAIACAPLQPDGTFGQAVVSGKAMGGPGGGPQPLSTCHPSEFISDVVITRTEGYQIAFITYRCTSPVTGAKRYVSSNGGRGPTGAGQYCPPGEAAKGFDVRFGKHVNGLGLICDTYTVPVPPPPPVAEAPPPCPFTQTRIDGACACPPGQTFSEGDGQCIIPRPADAGGALQMWCKAGPGMSGVEEARGLLVCFAVPAEPNSSDPEPGECVIVGRPLQPGEPAFFLVPPVDNSNRRLLAEAVNGGTFQLHVTPREDAFRVTSIDGVQVMGGVLSAGPVEATPAPAGGGMTTSTCGLSGTATVVIANPALTVLNVRDEPDGKTILGTIPENTQVEVLGPCGVKFSAGITALPQGAGGKVIAGWCAVSTPQVAGCSKEEFLVAGIPAGGSVTPPGSAGFAGPQVVAASSFTGT